MVPTQQLLSPPSASGEKPEDQELQFAQLSSEANVVIVGNSCYKVMQTQVTFI